MRLMSAWTDPHARRVHVQAIREHGRGFGHHHPEGTKPRTRIETVERRFRRAFKGILPRVW